MRLQSAANQSPRYSHTWSGNISTQILRNSVSLKMGRVVDLNFVPIARNHNTAGREGRRILFDVVGGVGSFKNYIGTFIRCSIHVAPRAVKYRLSVPETATINWGEGRGDDKNVIRRFFRKYSSYNTQRERDRHFNCKRPKFTSHERIRKRISRKSSEIFHVRLFTHYLLIYSFIYSAFVCIIFRV